MKLQEADRPIAVFDSGLGGISVLRKLHALLPEENLLYFGDSLHAPYGIKSQEELIRRCEEILKGLISRGAKCVVVACNTATSAAVPYLRENYPMLPIIGMEPAVKPAALSRPHPRVLVMATPVTIRGSRLHELVSHFDDEAEFVLMEAPEIVAFVENGVTDAHPSEELTAYLTEKMQPYLPGTEDYQPVDAIVLGCTHFPFVQEAIRKTFPYPVEVFDGAYGTAMQTRRRLEAIGLLRGGAGRKPTLEAGQTEPVQRGQVELQNSDPSKLGMSWELFEAE